MVGAGSQTQQPSEDSQMSDFPSPLWCDGDSVATKTFPLLTGNQAKISPSFCQSNMRLRAGRTEMRKG